MTTLALTLRGEADNAVLATVRRWPYWLRVVVERDPEDEQRYLAVTLITDVMHEPTIREILKRSFNLTFPDLGTKNIPIIEKQGRHAKTRRAT